MAVAPRVDPAVAGVRHAITQRHKLLAAARGLLTGLKEDVGQLVLELETEGEEGEGQGSGDEEPGRGNEESHRRRGSTAWDDKVSSAREVLRGLWSQVGVAWLGCW